MSTIFSYQDTDALGTVRSVDTATVIVHVPTPENLRKLQVNRLAVLRSSKPGQHLIGIIQKISRTSIEGEKPADDEDSPPPTELNLVRIALIGTHLDRRSTDTNVFVRTLETVPEIDAKCFALEGEVLTRFMEIIASIGENTAQRLSLGTYTLDETAEAFLNGNKFFQRHAVIVGGTGSGKSWTTAKVLEQVSKLPNANAIIFDLHGEYGPLQGGGFRHFKIAGPSDLDANRSLKDGVIHLPYWLLSYDAMVSMFIDRSDNNAPNQAMVISRAVIAAKQAYLSAKDEETLIDNFTIDSPIPFDLAAVLEKLEELDTQDVEGARPGTTKAGEFKGKLGRLIQRLKNKQTDRRLGFLFQGGDQTLEFNWLEKLSSALIAGSKDQSDECGGVKVVNFSEVPSDILPLIVSLVAKLAFSVQQWTANKDRHPIALFCDEAHLYIPERTSTDSSGEVSVQIFERIAKEGRKYGLGLVVISQRPSEVNRTVMSQCNNLIAMRLTNGDDQNVVRRLLPDSLGGFGDLLPILDTGEALVVGDATLLPTRIRIAEPENKPDSATVAFWEEWAKEEGKDSISSAVANWRRQSVQS
ncbi:ATP-binding protein [Roseibacillus persicicus]|uniref:Sea9 n=1 Tax=Roseibacillus persicicus TaxID=454148 RepID=A0A918TJG7_9BACT|nr:ATP-binding protein [Roseibacillus persicicus]GHC49860.1 sea9 [Roseibacillus persicicus]